MAAGGSITEVSAIPPSDIAAPTAVPAFIGFTAKAPAVMEPVTIASMADFESVFGGADASRISLYDSMRLFYANGGGSCYVVSVGESAAATVDAALLTKGLSVIGKQAGPTMLVIPELVLVDAASYGEIVQAMLMQCATLGDRVAIVDVLGGAGVTSQSELDATVAAFRDAVGSDHLSWGAAYFPFLQTTDLAVLPPSGAMAGVYAQADATVGVWNAPANVALADVAGTTYPLTNEQQDDLSLPIDGKAVNALREFTGRGTVVRGARTLDGNSDDYRYIQVHRTLIYIEQSIKNALNLFVFAANDGTTWATVTGMITTFLTGLWLQGGLLGSTAAEAFAVECGLGTTMTSQDVLDGYMRVQVTLQMVRPAEFIELTVAQKMLG